MKQLHVTFVMAPALAAGLLLAVAAPLGVVGAIESATIPTNPGFNPDTGQINPGRTEQAPTASSEVRNIPTPEEARAALMMPISTQPSLGDSPADTAGAAVAPATTGKASPTSANASAEPPLSGPIGAVGQTVPAKFSKRNDILDRVPIMAWPLALSDQQRQQIYQAVMADKPQPPAAADALEPASQLSTDQALNGMHPLPAGLRDVASLKGLKYVKAKDRVLLVEPSTRIVVDQIAQ